ncbi:MAG: histidine phosphatase family protein [Dehalococcoidia bacterium]
MGTTALLIRHGTVESNSQNRYPGGEDEDLNPEGYIQASRLAERISFIPVTSIYTSPAKRARATARTISEYNNIELVEEDDFMEINLGEWEGRYRDEIKKEWPEKWHQLKTDPSAFAYPGGESYFQVTERAVRGFNRVMEENSGKRIAIVSHEVIICVLVAHMLGVDSSICPRIEIYNGSISMVRSVDGVPLLSRLNDISHLQAQEEYMQKSAGVWVEPTRGEG